MYPEIPITPATSAFYRPFTAARSAVPTPRVEIPSSQSITPNLIPAGHREAVMSAAIPAVLGIQTLFVRGLTNGDKRRLDDHLDNPSEVSTFLAA